MATDSTINLPGLSAGDAEKLKAIDLSICIVTYNASAYDTGAADTSRRRENS